MNHPTAGWTLQFDFDAPSEVVEVLTSAIETISEEVARFYELTAYHSLTWTVRRRTASPDEYIGLVVNISADGQDKHGFGLPLQLDQPETVVQLADEFQNMIMDDFVLWPQVDDKILSAGLIANEPVWHHNGVRVIGIGHLGNSG